MMVSSREKPLPKKRTLTADEKKLWKYITRHDTPLHGAQVEQETLPTKPAAPIVKRYRPSAPAPSSAQHSPAPTLSMGSYAGIDRNTAERFRKGQYAFDGTLDLHGMSRDKAFNTFVRFIRGHYDKNSRCLLVITGKGMRKDTEEPRGIIREMLPKWLTEPELQSTVLAFDQARPKHGGQGAYYILLRRKRS